MAAYNAIIATIVMASDAPSETRAMIHSSQWRAGTSGTWLSTDCTFTAGNTYQMRTVNSNFDSSTIVTMPDIKADISVAWDTSGTVVTTIGDYFMRYYVKECSSILSFSPPDTSSITSVGRNFMDSCCYGTAVTKLSPPDTSNITSCGSYFLYSYARVCTSLTSLGIPDTSSLTTINSYFMYNYARGATSLSRLELPAVGYFESNNISWNVESSRLGSIKGYVDDEDNLQDWKDLTVSGKTLYTNYIQDSDDVIYEAPVVENTSNFFQFF